MSNNIKKNPNMMRAIIPSGEFLGHPVSVF